MVDKRKEEECGNGKHCTRTGGSSVVKAQRAATSCPGSDT
eukprot:CAMPEP_0204410340 /NCGR_PEP_ID=MMETSP0470-20130426/10674_1 /ASSEMBLY_ACC=CAM_ASM_000385 /TAXON_ID=2969 /ORGANISM="Oxyrrhis marina" /LENGTH=39 /DNA_ID= /DNA_START= /DNA_END= /DNA_ORIENTATION=